MRSRWAFPNPLGGAARSGLARPRSIAVATLTELVRLERMQRGPHAAIRHEQLDRLQAMLEDARRSVFWADHLAGIPAPATVDELAVWPTVDKVALRSASEEERLTSPVPAGTRTLRTSGTTGEPFRVRYAPGGAWWQGVLRLRALRARRVPLRGREAPMVMFRDEPPASTTRLTASVRRMRELPLVVTEPLGALAERVIAGRPTVIRGFPHLVMELGDALDGRYRPRALFTHGETLTDESRTELERQFGVAPLDGFGTAECGAIAWQCAAADLYHVNHEAVIVEVVDDSGSPMGPGETGHVLLTQLWNPLMPFVRLAIGDSAAWAARPCRCGSELPALTDVAGRTFDWVIDAGGARVAPQRLVLSMHLGVDNLRSVRRYRMRQDRDRRIRVEVVPSTSWSDALGDRLAASYRDLLGDLPVEVRVVDHLETPPGEKFEVVSSEAGRPTGH